MWSSGVQVFWLGVLKLSVDYRPEVAYEHNLIQGDFFGLLILDMSNTAIGEGVPLNFKLTKHTLDCGKNKDDDFAEAGKPKVIDVL